MLFYGAKEVEVITGVSRSKAYSIIKQLTEEIEKKGKISPKAGKIQTSYFCERMGLPLKECEKVLLAYQKKAKVG